MEKAYSIEYICKEHDRIFSERKKEYAIVVQWQTEVTYGFDNDCDIEYCKDHGVPVFYRSGAGGCIIHAKGNISLTLCYTHDDIPDFLSEKLAKDFRDFLKGKGVEANLDGNDVMIDGFKVASGYDNNMPPDWRWCQSGFQFSVNQDLDLIAAVCKKPMVKIPRGLSHYGITTEEVEGWLDNWVKENFDEKRTD